MYKLQIDGDDADEIMGILRSIGANKNVDITEERDPVVDPLEAMVHYLSRISNHLNRISRDLQSLSTTNVKLDYIGEVIERDIRERARHT